MDEGNVSYTSVDDVLYTKDKTRLLQCPAKKSGNFAIPNSVTYDLYWELGVCGLRWHEECVLSEHDTSVLLHYDALLRIRHALRAL